MYVVTRSIVRATVFGPVVVVAACAPAPRAVEPEPVAVVVPPTPAPEPIPPQPSATASQAASPPQAASGPLPIAIPLGRYKPALESYSSSVGPGNQTSLSTASVPFASYLNAIHVRIHPLFADGFLASLAALPPNHPMNDPGLTSILELVLAGDSGAVSRIGVIRTSGQTSFDIAALDSVMRASPFGKPPDAIRSPDGNVYVHWEFHRDAVKSCSTAFARPFLLSR